MFVCPDRGGGGILSMDFSVWGGFVQGVYVQGCFFGVLLKGNVWVFFMLLQSILVTGVMIVFNCFRTIMQCINIQVI